MTQADSEHSSPPLNTPSHIAALLAAAAVLDELAAGNQPDRARVIAGALALDTLIKTTTPSRDLLDAAAGLQILATGGTLELDETGRRRSDDRIGYTVDASGALLPELASVRRFLDSFSDRGVLLKEHRGI